MSGLILFAALLALPQSAPTPMPTVRPKLPPSRSATAPPRGKSLAEVARGIKLRFPAGQGPVITNESLRELSSGVELTTGTAPPPAAGGERPYDPAADEASKKAYWQERYFTAQRELSQLQQEAQRLGEEVARLERDFYARDDPYQRDNVIKPAWDAALARLREVQQRLPEAQVAPEQIANEARRDGALPGWFREPPPMPSAAPDGGERNARH